jgi:hypothetical protein
MAVYIDAQDIRQHVRGAQGVPVPNINEIMEEVEAYIAAELDLGDSLPPNNPVLRSMVREFATARVILDLLPVSSENIARVQLHNQNGQVLLKSARREGITPNDISGRVAENEVYQPHPTPLWPIEDFQP